MNTAQQNTFYTPPIRKRSIKAGIVCGCLPVQAGIAPDELYHRLLSATLKTQTGNSMESVAVWYSTLAQSGEKLTQLESQDCSPIFFHVRPDPFLRLCRLLIRYKGQEGPVRYRLNLEATDFSILEKIYPPRNSRPLRRKNLLVNFLRNSNYIAGILAGLPSRAISFQLDVVSKLEQKPTASHGHLIVIGPPQRPLHRLENYLLRRLESRLQRHFAKSSIPYISFFSLSEKAASPMFLADGVHVSPYGHHLLANALEPVLLKMLNND